MHQAVDMQNVDMVRVLLNVGCPVDIKVCLDTNFAVKRLMNNSTPYVIKVIMYCDLCLPMKAVLITRLTQFRITKGMLFMHQKYNAFAIHTLRLELR